MAPILDILPRHPSMDEIVLVIVGGYTRHVLQLQILFRDEAGMADIPESRSYRHIKCDTQTEISGQAFEVMSNPISDMTRTWCTQCDDYFPLSDYEWSDTGENVTKYYERHSSKATPLQRTLCSKKCMIVLAGIGFILGAAGGYFLFRDQALWVKIVFTPVCGGFGVFIGCAVYISAICEPITRKVCGVKDTRTLT